MQPSPPHPASIKITGILIPVAWASTGKITRLAIATFDEKEYWVAPEKKIERWQKWLNHKVSVHGTVYEHDGRQWFSVNSFQPLESKYQDRSDEI